MKELIDKAKSKYENVEAIVSGYTMRVEWASPNLHKILGYEEGELIDINVNELLKINPIEVTKLIVEAVNDTANDTNKVYKKDGSQIVLKTTAGVIIHDKEPHIIISDAKVIEE